MEWSFAQLDLFDEENVYSFVFVNPSETWKSFYGFTPTELKNFLAGHITIKKNCLESSICWFELKKGLQTQQEPQTH